MMRHPSTSPCVILGAGIAGINAAIWLKDFGVPLRWLADGPTGGILRRVNNTVHNFPGHNAPNGMAIVERHVEQLNALGIDLPTQSFIEHIEQTPESFILHQRTGPSLSTQQVILATGTTYKTLRLKHRLDQYISQSVSGDARKVAGQTVAVVGGGDAAFEGALILANVGCTVHLFCRSPQFKARPEFVERVLNTTNIKLWPVPTQVLSMTLTPSNRCSLHLRRQGQIEHCVVQRLFIRIGVAPATPQLPQGVSCDAQGYLNVNKHMHTSLPGLLAAGDVTNQPLRAVVNAASDGARAARSAALALGYVHA